MKVEAKPIGEALAFQPFVLTIQADNPGEQIALEKFGMLNETIPNHLKNSGDLNAEQAVVFTNVQTAVSGALGTYKRDLAAAADAGKMTSARRKRQ